MKKVKPNQLKLNKSKVSDLLGLELEKIRGGVDSRGNDSGRRCLWSPESCRYQRCDDYDYSTNGCPTTWGS